jgi:hypothetical protein
LFGALPAGALLVAPINLCAEQLVSPRFLNHRRPAVVHRDAFRLEVEFEVDRGDLSDGLGVDGVRSLEVW